MNSHRFAFFRLAPALSLLLAASLSVFAQTPNPAQDSVLQPVLQPILLPAPHKTGGLGLMQALAQRKTTRAFSSKPLPAETLEHFHDCCRVPNRRRNQA